VLVATEKAGNTREVPRVYELKNVKYRKSTIALTDSFLQNKVVPLVKDADARQGGGASDNAKKSAGPTPRPDSTPLERRASIVSSH